ncbi:unnamed protein product, partial [Laminaria digitata]
AVALGGGGGGGDLAANLQASLASGGSYSPVKIMPLFGQYSRPRTLSSGDVGSIDDSGGGGGDHVTNPTLARLATALKSHMDKVYSSEILRCLQRRMPVTLLALQNVLTCLDSMPTEVTNFLVPLEFMVDIS